MYTALYSDPASMHILATKTSKHHYTDTSSVATVTSCLCTENLKVCNYEYKVTCSASYRPKVIHSPAAEKLSQRLIDLQVEVNFLTHNKP